MKTNVKKPASAGKWHDVTTTANLSKYIPTGGYYFRGTVNGVGYSRRLKTDNLTLAKRKVVEMADQLRNAGKGGGKITLIQLLEEYKLSRGGKNIGTIDGVITQFSKIPALGKKQISQIKSIEIAQVFSDLKLAPAYKKQHVNTLNASFEMAVGMGYIINNPMKVLDLKEKIVRKKPQAPTFEQFEKIRETIRGNKHSDTAEAAFELFSFCGMFGCYEADANNLDWSDINFEKGRISMKKERQQHFYSVPIFDYALAFLTDLWERRGKPIRGKVFLIRTCKRSLDTACKKLGFPHFTIIRFRSMFICKALYSGVSAKKCSQWVGHQDGGVLIMRTYSEVISDMDDAQEKADISKMG